MAEADGWRTCTGGAGRIYIILWAPQHQCSVHNFEARGRVGFHDGCKTIQQMEWLFNDPFADRESIRNGLKRLKLVSSNTFFQLQGQSVISWSWRIQNVQMELLELQKASYSFSYWQMKREIQLGVRSVIRITIIVSMSPFFQISGEFVPDLRTPPREW